MNLEKDNNTAPNSKTKTKNAAGEEISKAIYEMLLEINAPENLKKSALI